jgi:hypothetical protein
LPLEWRQVDRKAHTIESTSARRRNKRGRVVNYADNTELCDLFGQLWREHEALAGKGTICPWVFYRNGRRIKTFKNAWKTAREDADTQAVSCTTCGARWSAISFAAASQTRSR